jgi:ribosomal protein L13E
LHIKTKDDETKKLEALLSPKSFERKKVARRRLSSWYLDDKRGDILNEDKYNPYGIFHLREAGYDDSTIIGMNFPLKLLWAANVCPLLLRTKGKYSAMKLKVAGYTCSEAYGAGYSIEQLKQAGFSAADLYDTGASCQDLKFVGFDADTILRAGYSINQMKLAGFSLTSLHKAGADVASLVAANFSLAELRAIGLNATQLRKGGVDNPTSLRNAGYSLSNLKAAGFTSIELKKAGYSYDDLKDVGFDDIQLSSSGFHDSDTNTNTHLFSLYIDAERKALVDLWLSTGGPKWKNKTNWNSAKPLSEWFGIIITITLILLLLSSLLLIIIIIGITVNGRGHVTKVILPSNNLQGSIPDSIHLLSYVKEIDMRMNQLSGINIVICFYHYYYHYNITIIIIRSNS